jgi:NADH-quinone oxidoreductase subunit M
MADVPWLSLAAGLPLAGAALAWALPGRAARWAKHVALAASLGALAVVLLVAVRFDVSAAASDQFVEQYAWIPQLGVSYAVGVDGIALVMLALTAILVPACLLASWNDVELAEGTPAGRLKTFFALVLLLETLLLLVFAAADVFLFYVCFEAMLIPMYFLIGLYGGPRRRYAALKFLVYSLAGGLLMLAAVVGVYVAGPGGPDGFLTENLVGAGSAVGVGVERLLFLGFFVAFAIKAPMWPVHTWLPDAAEQSPAGVAVLLVGVLDKVGTFGMITLCLPLFPRASAWATPTVVVLAVVSVLYGALLAIGQRDLKRLLAFTSVSHFGFIVLGIFALTTPGQSGSVLYMVNHGFSTAALFLVAGMLVTRRGSQLIADYGGLQRVTPLLAGTFLVAGLSSLALPGLSSFVSEFLVLAGTFQRYPVAAVLATLGIVLAALYILLAYQRMMTGPVREELRETPDLGAREAWVLAPLLAVIVALGFYPRPVLDVLTPAVERTLEQAQAVDPAPRLDLAAAEPAEPAEPAAPAAPAAAPEDGAP